VCAAALIVAAAIQPPATPATSSFTIFLKGVPVGTEQSSVTRGADGWTIASSGRMGAPIDLVARRVQVRYDPDWKPLELTVNATLRGQPLSIHTMVNGTSATSAVTNAGQSSEKTDTIAADALLLPNPFWGPFEALAVRIRTVASGATLPVYAAPNASYTIKVGDSTTERIQTTERLIEAHRTALTIAAPGAPLDAEIWTDETGQLLRFTVPAQTVDVVREDIASVAARRVTVSRANDEAVRMAADGFALVGTLSRPEQQSARPLPAVLLVGGSGPTDRDELVFGIPIFGQLSSALADAGFVVVRYDKRGVGQSGGRPEAATLADFADDVRAAVKFLEARKDVDPKHIAVIGHSEGGSVAMLAAARDKRISALVLIDSIGVTGAELNLAQVTHALERSNKSEADRQSTIELQKKVQQAVLTGQGWDDIPANIRKQADTPWFQSFLSFDPAKVMRDVRQPILIVQSELDKQVDPSNADKLEALARPRKNSPPAEVVRIPGINHLLVPATTGETDEYGTLKDKRISPTVASTIAGWLQKTFAAAR
jgi:pimeloyl-ACP methyl ester carboxylesterase